MEALALTAGSSKRRSRGSASSTLILAHPEAGNGTDGGRVVGFGGEGLAEQRLGLVDTVEDLVALGDGGGADIGRQGLDGAFEGGLGLGLVFATEVEGGQADPALRRRGFEADSLLEPLLGFLRHVESRVDLAEPEEVAEVGRIVGYGLLGEGKGPLRVAIAQGDVGGEPLDVTAGDFRPAPSSMLRISASASAYRWRS